jgi:hypothetical protein
VDGILLEIDCINDAIIDSDVVVVGFVTTTSSGELSNRFSIDCETDSTVVSKFIGVEAELDFVDGT